MGRLILAGLGLIVVTSLFALLFMSYPGTLKPHHGSQTMREDWGEFLACLVMIAIPVELGFAIALRLHERPFRVPIRYR